MRYIWEYLNNCSQIADKINAEDIYSVVEIVSGLKGRLFVIGSGGGAGHASHAVCDFRKLCHIEAYAPYDNVSELTARTNDEGFQNTIADWLSVSNFNTEDCLFVFSVGGGTDKVSLNITTALLLAQEVGAKIVGIVGKDGGKTKELGDAVIVIPEFTPVTPLTEGWQSVIWHLIVSHPKLQKNKTVW